MKKVNVQVWKNYTIEDGIKKFKDFDYLTYGPMSDDDAKVFAWDEFTKFLKDFDNIQEDGNQWDFSPSETFVDRYTDYFGHETVEFEYEDGTTQFSILLKYDK